MSVTPKQIEAKRRKLREFLGNECAKCGFKGYLEFDHINPKSVKFRIGQKYHYGYEKLLIEAKKCQLLCRKCHWAKTRIDRGLNGKAHGTVNMYNNYRCRCELCREAWNIYFVPRITAYRKRKKMLI